MSTPPATERRRHAEILADIARFTSSSLDLDDVLEHIVERAAALTGADRTSIWLLDRAERRLLPSALFGMDPEFTQGWKQRPLDLGEEPLSREVLATGDAVIVEDALADPRTDKRSVEFFGDRSLLVVPLSRRGRVIGTLFMNHVRDAYTFSTDDVETAQAIANQAAIAIDNARLYRDTRLLADRLHRSFRHAGEALATGVDMRRNLQLMLRLAVETVDADGGVLHLLHEDGRGTDAVADTGRQRASHDFTARYPLFGEVGPLGAIELWREALDFNKVERDLLDAFAGHARLAIEHARLYARLQEEQARARAAEKIQADFSAMVSHELRTPIALIKGYVRTLLFPPSTLTPERQRRFMEGIDSATNRLQRLIDNLLSASRLESELFGGRPHPIEVKPLVERAVAAAAVLDGDREISVDLPPEDLWILGDADQLAQVLENLIGNALKYAPRGTPVVIAAHPNSGRVHISVQDSGPGIPEDAVELIFQKFYRVLDPEAAAGAPTRGLGLGLYISRRIVEAHGGRIWARNGDGAGSIFTMELTASARPTGPNRVPS